MYGRGVVKTILKGTLAAVSGVVTHTRPPDLKKIQKTWKITTVAPLPLDIMYRGPQGTPGRPGVIPGVIGAAPPQYSGFLPFL